VCTHYHAACGKPAEVPFRPDGSKPVLCRDCFASNKSDDRGGFAGRDRSSNDRGGRDSRPERNFESPRSDRGSSLDYKALLTQVSTLEAKMNEILSILKTTSVPVDTPAAEVVMEAAEVSVKEKKPKNEVAMKVVKKAAEKVAEKKVAKKVVKKAAKKVVKK
jgi:CxxC-x17-CxxC domain-containing protein